MKNLHFCTPKKIEEVTTCNFFKIIRTGFIPMIYAGDIVALKKRIGTQDHFVGKAKVESIYPITFAKIKDDVQFEEELSRYGRKFNDGHYFFLIILKKVEVEGST